MRKHVMRVVRRRKPDDLISLLGTWVILVVGLLGLYFAGTAGVYAAVVVMALVAVVIGLATRSVKWVVRLTRFRAK
jgi:hypothetical protein